MMIHVPVSVKLIEAFSLEKVKLGLRSVHCPPLLMGAVGPAELLKVAVVLQYLHEMIELLLFDGSR
jgi:hypothetical protein